MVKHCKMFVPVPGYGGDYDKVGPWVEETHRRLVAKERKPSVAK